MKSNRGSLLRPDDRYWGGYSSFDFDVYINRAAEWLFPQEKATLHDLKLARLESKIL